MNIDEKSVKALCGTSNKIVVFGFGRYKYIEACEAINKIKAGIQRVSITDGFSSLAITRLGKKLVKKKAVHREGTWK